MADALFVTYQALLFVHVLSAFLFMFAHGASATVMFRLKKEREAARARALLELSESVSKWMTATSTLMFFSGVVLGIVLHALFADWLWKNYWFWTALVLLIVISVPMTFLGRVYFERVRKVVGLPFVESGKKGKQPAIAARSEDEIAKVVALGRPVELGAFGLVGIGVLLFLMMFKPF